MSLMEGDEKALNCPPIPASMHCYVLMTTSIPKGEQQDLHDVGREVAGRETSGAPVGGGRVYRGPAPIRTAGWGPRRPRSLSFQLSEARVR